jgi:hypothetical protein
MYMPALLFQVVTLVFDLSVIVFVTVYVLGVRKKERDVDRKEGKIDHDYQAIIEQGRAQERQIIENAMSQSNQMMQVATHQANQILAGTQFITQSTKTTLDAALQKMVVEVQNVGSNSKIALEQNLQQIINDVHKEAFNSGNEAVSRYQASLQQITSVSLTGFQKVTNQLELSLQQQIKEFRTTLLANLEKEVESYKQSKIHRIDQASSIIVQRVAQEVLNKSLSLEDHQALVIQSLEKAKKEGIFD